MHYIHQTIPKQLALHLLFWLLPLYLSAQQTFGPPVERMSVKATAISANQLEIDGLMDEWVWQKAQVVQDFTQRNPIQGAPASKTTKVKVLYDQEFLYIGAICYDSLPDKKQLRVLNLQRDFSAYQNDRFSVAIDGMMDQRNAVGFEVTPYGAQRELQVIDGAEFNGNVNWDALWFVRTHITDSAWVLEMAIPWKTLRYSEGGNKMLLSFSRNIRVNNEVTTWPSFPRAFSHFRMAYAAELTDLNPPPPAANIQINPYLLANTEGFSTEDSNIKAGGEFKWAITPNTVLDATINTDFAQADVDQQVQNLTRFSVLFPERRQFFLENANIFKTSSSDFIQPFFSRKIGLDDNGQPLPLDGGLRLTSQTTQQTSGILTMRQRATDRTPAANFLTARYARNFSEQNRLGGMLTFRQDDAFEQDSLQIPSKTNATATIDGFFRPQQSFSVESMLSFSNDHDAGQGLAAHAWVWQSKNWGYLGLIGQYVTKNYLPGTGFLAFKDYSLISPSVDLDLRPDWLPSFIRSFGPDGYTDIYWRASDGAFQQAIAGMAPIDLEFQQGGDFEIRIKSEWQHLDEPFSPLGIDIEPGFYQFNRIDVGFTTDFSRKIAGQGRFETGGYYNGSYDRWYADVRLSPIPHIELISSYQFNQFRRLGEQSIDLNTHLLSSRIRLALNPRIQMIGSYQWNSVNAADIWNVRFSWEYRPLSFVYLVFNSNQSDDLITENRLKNQELIGKLTFLKQF